MKNHTILQLTLFSLVLMAACSREPAMPDTTTLSWVDNLGYTNDDLFPIISGGAVPGPQVKVTVNSESQYLLIDINTIDFIVKENTYKDVNFEPQRMSNRISETAELMFEEGFLHNVRFLNMEFPILYVSMIKRSSTPFRERGIVGRNFLVDGQLTLDLRNKIIAFSNNPLATPADLATDSNLVDFNFNLHHSESSGLLKFYCYINGKRYLATLSTRIATTQISNTLARTFTKNDQNTVTIESLKIGGSKFADLKCTVNDDLMILEPENNEPINIIIGVDVLNQCVWTIDFINKQMLVL